jgi:hypothetical protein
VQATASASRSNGKGKVVARLGKGPPRDMLPACPATHRAARSSPIHDDPVAAANATVLDPLPPPASPSRDYAPLGFAHPRGHPRIALVQRDARQLIATAERSGCRCRLRSQRNRHRLTPSSGPSARSRCRRFRPYGSERVRGARQLPSLVAEPPLQDSPDPAGLSVPPDRTSRCLAPSIGISSRSSTSRTARSPIANSCSSVRSRPSSRTCRGRARLPL